MRKNVELGIPLDVFRSDYRGSWSWKPNYVARVHGVACLYREAGPCAVFVSGLAGPRQIDPAKVRTKDGEVFLWTPSSVNVEMDLRVEFTLPQPGLVQLAVLWEGEPCREARRLAYTATVEDWQDAPRAVRALLEHGHRPKLRSARGTPAMIGCSCGWEPSKELLSDAVDAETQAVVHFTEVQIRQGTACQ